MLEQLGKEKYMRLGLHARENWGRYAVPFLVSFFIIIFSIQKGYGTLTQNLVKFKNTQVNNNEVKPFRSY